MQVKKALKEFLNNNIDQIPNGVHEKALTAYAEKKVTNDNKG